MPTTFEFVGVLFADIQGFSELHDDEIQAFTDDVLKALATDVVDRHRKDLIELNTWGDAIFATSKDPIKLAQFALDLRDFFGDPSYDHETLYQKLRIRIALHFPRVRIAKNYILSSDGSVEGFFGSELTLAARIEPVTPPNTIFVTKPFAGEINSRSENMKAVPFREEVFLPKGAGSIRVYSLHRKPEKVIVDWQDPLKKLAALAPMHVDSWFVADVPRHKEVEARLSRCKKGESVRFIAITGKSIIFPYVPSNKRITDVSFVARAIDKGVCIRGVVLDRKCGEAAFRSKIEGNTILVRDAKCIERIPTDDDWKALGKSVKTNLLLRKTRRGLSFNLWLFDDKAIVEPYHFGKLPERSGEPHMCKFSQFTIFRERDEEYRMLEQHFENLWKDASPVWP